MNYADQPKSIGEHKAFKEGDCKLWTPRDLLLFYLRRIDQGEQFDGLMVVYLKKSDGGSATGFHRSKTTLLECLGMLEAVKHDMLTDE